MGLDRLGDDLVAALATAAGVHDPAPPGTAAEEKQVWFLEPLRCDWHLSLKCKYLKRLSCTLHD